MRQMRLLVVGKTKDRYLQEGLEHFLKRLGPYTKLEIVVLKDAAAKAPEAAKADEGARLIAQLDAQAYVIALDEKGQSLSSEGLAKHLEQRALEGFGKIDWIIGGAWGLSAEVKKRADLTLSLSKMTFTHQMARLFLAEQIYRALSILKGEKYHNP